MSKRTSELVREAGQASQVHKDNERYCYCTPSRAMVRSVHNVCLNENLPDAEKIAAEMQLRIAEKMRELTGRDRYQEDLEEFDTMDTSAAYALDDYIVRESFEQAAVLYEAEEIAAWDAAKAAWEESVRVAARPPVRRQVAPALDPAAQRGKATAKAQESTVKDQA